MLADFYIPRLLIGIKIAVQKKNLILYSSPDTW